MINPLLIVQQAGLVASYAPHRDDVVVITLLVCFFLMAYVLASNSKFLLQLMQGFLLNRKRASIFATSTSGEVHEMVLLVAVCCVLAGICLFTLCVGYRPALIDHLPSYALLGIYAGIMGAYLILKWISYRVLGWVFLNKENTDLCIESYLTLVYYSSFYFLLLAVAEVYLHLPFWTCVTLFLLALVLFRIFIFYKWIKLFSVNFYGIFRFFLYFCALEIVPIILLGATVLITNELLIL